MFVYTKNSIHKLSSSPGDYPDPGKDVKEVRKKLKLWDDFMTVSKFDSVLWAIVIGLALSVLLVFSIKLLIQRQ